MIKQSGSRSKRYVPVVVAVAVIIVAATVGGILLKKAVHIENNILETEVSLAEAAPAVLTGYSEPMVESLIDGMFDIESQTAKIEMDIECSISATDVSFDAVAGGEFEMQVSGMNGKSARTSYIDGKMTVEVQAIDFDEGMEFEAYSIVDDGTVARYSCIDGDDTWYVTELGDDVLDQDTMDKMTEAMKVVLKENGKLAEDTEEVEGEECYVITATIEGSDWLDILKTMQSILDDAIEEADVDIDMLSWFENCSADITYYFSKDTGYLVKTEMDMSDTDIYNMIGQMMEDIGLEQVFGEYEEMIEETSFSKLYISVVFSDVNDTEVEIPDDVIYDAYINWMMGRKMVFRILTKICLAD